MSQPLADWALSDRLRMARRVGAEVINFETEDPAETLQRLTSGLGPDRVIDEVGVDATSRDQRLGRSRIRRPRTVRA